MIEGLSFASFLGIRGTMWLCGVGRLEMSSAELCELSGTEGLRVALRAGSP